MLDAAWKELGSVTFQQFLGNDGLEIVVPGIATVVLGEDPRAIDGDATSTPVSEPTRARALAPPTSCGFFESDIGRTADC